MHAYAHPQDPCPDKDFPLAEVFKLGWRTIPPSPQNFLLIRKRRAPVNRCIVLLPGNSHGNIENKWKVRELIMSLINSSSYPITQRLINHSVRQWNIRYMYIFYKRFTIYLTGQSNVQNAYSKMWPRLQVALTCKQLNTPVVNNKIPK